METYSVYIGANGAGKSGILEALDVFFNGRDWNVSRGSTREDVYITPVFLVEKQAFREKCFKNSSNSPEEINRILDGIGKVSAEFWGDIYNAFQGATRRDYIVNFFTLLKSVTGKYSEENYYIAPIGVRLNGKPTMAPFDNYFKNILGKTDYEKEVEKIRQLIRNFHSFVYIPVEQNADEILKIEARQMQTLMNKNVLEEIDRVLNSKFEIKGRNRSFLTFVNDHLNEFMEDINTAIQKIDSNYSYSAEVFGRKNLTVTDIREKVLEAYFSKRSLRHNNRELHQLSSGEQRKSLIDIAYAFLSKMGQSDKEIILAIDEPEVSMNISNCFPQFERLEELASKYKKQVLVTTHWYGSLPITNHGYLFHINRDENSDILNISQFSFYNYLEERRRFPDDVEFKSMFDLATSILSYSKSAENANWIICEGSEDKLYLQSILGETTNIRILPVGGCGNVIKLYGLLSYPLLDKTTSKALNGKILCLIDTDERRINVAEVFNSDRVIDLRRLQISKKDNNFEIQLVQPWKQGELYDHTEIEDCLNPSTYFDSIQDVIYQSEDLEIKMLFDEYKINSNSKISRVSGDESILVPLSPNAYIGKPKLIEFLSRRDIKLKVAETYYSKCQQHWQNHELYEKLMSIFELENKGQTLQQETIIEYVESEVGHN